jgi:hypothetical protein
MSVYPRKMWMRRSEQEPSKVRTNIPSRNKANTIAVLLQRSISPSGRMAALSQQLSNVGPLDFFVEPSPHSKEESTLSRKLRSELNLADQCDARLAQSLPKFAALEQAETTQDTLKAVDSKVTHRLNDALEFDALVALRELGAQVARRRGIDVSSFVSGLSNLLSFAESSSGSSIGDTGRWSPTSDGHLKAPTDDVTLEPQQHKRMTQIRQGEDQKSQRHFSFDPGDDHMRVLFTNFRSYNSLSHTEPTDYVSPSSSEASLALEGSLREGDNDSVSLFPSAGVDIAKQSMIPSPVQRVGSIRRENSGSSPQSTLIYKNIQDDRQNSRTSVQTVFRNTSSAAFSSTSKSTGSPSQTLGVAESPLKSKERPNSLANQHNAALAAARAAEARSSGSSRSNTRLSTTAPHSRKQHPTRRPTAENHDSEKLG